MRVGWGGVRVEVGVYDRVQAATGLILMHTLTTTGCYFDHGDDGAVG